MGLSCYFVHQNAINLELNLNQKTNFYYERSSQKYVPKNERRQ